MYKVIEFESGEVEVVPEFWIKNDEVRWANTAKAYAKKKLQPKTSWKTYKCKTRFKDIIFDKYEDASNKCNILLYQTDSSDQNEEVLGIQNRKRVDNEMPDFEYYHDRDLDDLPQSPSSSEGDKTLTQEDLRYPSSANIPVVSFPPKNNGTSLVDSAKGTDNPNNIRVINNLTDLVLEPIICKCDEIKLLNTEIGTLKSEISDIKNLMKGVKEDLKRNSELIERFITQSKREWEAVKLTLSDKDQQSSNSNAINQELEKYFQELIPLTSVDDLNVLNETLLEEEKRIFFINRLKRIGGKDPKQLLSNIIKNLLTLETQKQCNWTGANGKYRIKECKMVEVIIEIVFQEHSKSTRSEMEAYLKYLFQHTYDRNKAAQRTANRKE